MKKLSYFIPLCLALGFASCKNNSNTNNNTGTTVTAPSGNNSTTANTGDLERKVSKMTTEGRLEGAEDAGYPMAYILVAQGEDDEMVTFDFNQEDSKGLKIEKMNPLLGKNVALEYERVEFLDAFDIFLNGKTIMERPEGTNCVKEIKGVLNAAEVTKGDLPSTYSIKTAEGAVYNFETFITPAMVAANGKEVTACLVKANKDNLISIKAK